MMTTRKNTWIVPLLGVLLIGLVGGCGSSEPVVGGDIERRLYVVQGQDIDEPPDIVGGYDRLDEIRTYPPAAEAEDAYGVIWLQFIVSASGSATQVRLVEGGHPALETEALNVVQNLDFQPATKNGAPVQARVQLPVIFEGPYRTPEEEEG